MHNLEIARLLEEIADLLEIKGENPYKIRAYRRGAQAVSLLPSGVGEIARQGGLERIDGIGKALRTKIEEWLATGEIAYLNELREEVPPGLIEVMKVPGIGPKLAKRLYDEIGVDGLDALKSAVREKRVQRVRGLGPKAEQKIERAIDQIAVATGRIPIGWAMPIAVERVRAIREAPGVVRAEVAGSLRRWAETVKDIDIVAVAGDAGPVMDRFVSSPQVAEVLAKGRTKSSVVLYQGLQVDLRVVPERSFASALHHFTGSKEHHVQLRELAQRRGYSISEYGLKRIESGELVYPESEDELYRLLGLPFIPPELREGRGEIERALLGSLPALVSFACVRGDLHVHSTWSDGRSDLVEIARAAAARGWSYVAICDHSRSLRIAGGLSGDDLKRQAEAIAAAEQAVGGVRLLRGVEVDILADGSLDLDDEILSELDWVVASIHSGLGQEREQLTRRLVRAMENPWVDVIGHPTGRILGRRSPSEIEFERVIETAIETQTILEINASPDRLDLCDTMAREAKEAGALFAVDTDAHHVDEFATMAFGIAVARRAWLEPRDVVNTWDLEAILAWRSARVSGTRA